MRSSGFMPLKILISQIPLSSLDPQNSLSALCQKLVFPSVLEEASVLQDIMCHPQDLNPHLLSGNRSITRVILHCKLAWKCKDCKGKKGLYISSKTSRPIQPVLYRNQINITELNSKRMHIYIRESLLIQRNCFWKIFQKKKKKHSQKDRGKCCQYFLGYLLEA